MKQFSIISIMLIVALLVVALLLDPIMAIFIVCVLVCLFMDVLDRKDDKYFNERRRR